MFINTDISHKASAEAETNKRITCDLLSIPAESITIIKRKN